MSGLLAWLVVIGLVLLYKWQHEQEKKHADE
jgi:hypothetical protein